MTVPPVRPGVHLGVRRGPFPVRPDRAFVRGFAAATRDPSPVARSGDAVPPVALAAAIWDVQQAARQAVVPEALQRSARTGVHGEHDVLLHRPVVPGEPLDVWVEGCGARPAGDNAVVTVRYWAVGADGRLVAEQWWSTVYIGVTCEPVGSRPPDHTFPPEARDGPVGRRTVEVDVEMAYRYAELSGDRSAHHFDADAARRSGHDRPFLHGLCTMALCARAVAELVADGDQRRLRRVAVRFAAPLYLDEVLEVLVFAIDESRFAFEARRASDTVISHGRAELW